MASDLDRQEKAITGILRPPLEQGRAIEDSAERAKDLKVLPGWGSCSRFHPYSILGHSKRVQDNYGGNGGVGRGAVLRIRLHIDVLFWHLAMPPDVTWYCF